MIIFIYRHVFLPFNNGDISSRNNANAWKIESRVILGYKFQIKIRFHIITITSLLFGVQYVIDLSEMNK